MCTSPIYITPKRVSTWRYMQGDRYPHRVPVPCGKCAECLKKKQNDLASRIVLESSDLSHIFFVTLTYKPEFEPVGYSFWQACRETGELSRLTCPEVLDDFHVDDCNLVSFAGLARTLFPECHDIYNSPSRVVDFRLKCAHGVAYRADTFPPKFDFSSDTIPSLINAMAFNLPQSWFEKLEYENSDLVLRIAPCLNPRDLRLALKNWRVNYERKNHHKLPDFRYCAVGEYGTQFTRRPHWHIVFCGKDLTKDLVEDFCKNYWRKNNQLIGRYEVDVVPVLDKDGNRCVNRVARYLGKYVSKGCFDIPNVVNGLCPKHRHLISKHFGWKLPQNEIDRYTCQDVLKYDIYKAHELPEDVKKVIIPEVVKRLKFQIIFHSDGQLCHSAVFGLPVAIKKQVFGYSISKTTGEANWASLWYLVADYLRNKADSDSQRKFRQMVSDFSSEGLSKACIIFNEDEERSLQDREEAARSQILNFYKTHSKI